MNLNKHITKTLLNEYAGSEKKKTVLMDDGNKYLLSFLTQQEKKDVICHILIMLSQNIYPVLFITSLEFQHKNNPWRIC